MKTLSHTGDGGKSIREYPTNVPPSTNKSSKRGGAEDDGYKPSFDFIEKSPCKDVRGKSPIKGVFNVRKSGCNKIPCVPIEKKNKSKVDTGLDVCNSYVSEKRNTPIKTNKEESK